MTAALDTAPQTPTAMNCGAVVQKGWAAAASGSLYAWGFNAEGQLGVGHGSNVLSPRPVVGGLQGEELLVDNLYFTP